MLEGYTREGYLRFKQKVLDSANHNNDFNRLIELLCLLELIGILSEIEEISASLENDYYDAMTEINNRIKGDNENDKNI